MIIHEQTDVQKRDPVEPRKEYKTPTLHVHGDIHKLTLGGSSGLGDGNGGRVPRS
jgi:hypothetical protein